MSSDVALAFRPRLDLNVIGLKSGLLLLAILLYAAGGSPTPDNLGTIEIFVGLLLVFATTNLQILPSRTMAPWQSRAQAAMVYGLTVPVAIGILTGAAPAAILRDIAAFIFMLLPFFMKRRPDGLTRLLVTSVVIAAGVIFAARAILRPLAHWAAGQKPVMTDTLYLANAPTVLFAALILLGLAWRELFAGATFGRTRKAAILAATAFIPLAAIVLATQRASIVAVILYGAGIMISALIYRPARAAMPLFAVLIAVFVTGEWGLKVYHVLALKTEMVGANMRWQEAVAVFDRLDGDSMAILFGKGWGAPISSPAVGGETINFTHSLVTSYWLKTGLCGLMFVLLYLFELGALLLQEARENPLLAAAIALPLLIDISLYASFKSLDFGLILLLIPLWASEVASEGQKI